MGVVVRPAASGRPPPPRPGAPSSSSSQEFREEPAARPPQPHRLPLAGPLRLGRAGRRHIGAIKGFATTLSVAGTAVGPLLFAVGRDASGTYLPVLLASATVPLVLAVAALWLRPPAREPVDATRA